MGGTVADVARLHAALLAAYPQGMTVGAVLERQAATLHREHAAGNPAVAVQLSNWLQRCVRRTDRQILDEPLTLDEARHAVAREHGFADWAEAMDAADRPLDAPFEAAVDATVTGDLDRLATLLDEQPDLVRRRSPYGHGAMLLHYVAANGVETWRQTVPANAVSVARLLIDRGADVKATARMYGGDHDTMALLVTSAHPAEAGLTEPLARVLAG